MNYTTTSKLVIYFFVQEGCVNMVFEPESGVIGEWNDVSCDSPKTYACEKNAS